MVNDTNPNKAFRVNESIAEVRQHRDMNTKTPTMKEFTSMLFLPKQIVDIYERYQNIRILVAKLFYYICHVLPAVPLAQVIKFFVL